MEPLYWNFETMIYHPNISRPNGEAVPGLLDEIPQELLVTPSPDPLHAIDPGVADEIKKNRERCRTGTWADPELQGSIEIPAPSHISHGGGIREWSI
ncbi:hypothetical protein VTN02DRAFT_4375 [Thermoascus thermophilus]